MDITRLLRNFLLFLFPFYFSQGFLYSTGFLSQFSLLLIFFISAIYVVKVFTIKNYKPLFVNIWTIFLVLNVFGFILTANMDDEMHLQMFKNIIAVLLPFYPFYYFTKEKEFSKKHLLIYFFSTFSLFIIHFVISKIELSQSIMEEDVVRNLSYALVMLIPFIFLVRNKLFSGMLVVVVVFFLVQSAKRGAVISGFVGLLAYFYYQIKVTKQKNKVFNYGLSFIIIVAISWITYTMFIANEFLNKRMNDMIYGYQGFGTGSVVIRESIYKNILSAWWDLDNLLNLFFGFGFASSIELSGSHHFAHNDWLELASNFGVIGVIVYFVVFYSIGRYLVDKRIAINKRIILISILLIWFFTSMYSMFYTSFFSVSIIILLAYIIGSEDYSEKVYKDEVQFKNV